MFYQQNLTPSVQKLFNSPVEKKVSLPQTKNHQQKSRYRCPNYKITSKKVGIFVPIIKSPVESRYFCPNYKNNSKGVGIFVPIIKAPIESRYVCPKYKSTSRKVSVFVPTCNYKIPSRKVCLFVQILKSPVEQQVSLSQL